MTTTTDPDPTPGSTVSADATAAEAYLADVRRHLGGLDEGERDDLLDDLVAHVHEVSTHDSRPLDEALGEPAAFAAELLATAGLTPDRPRGAGALMSSGAEIVRNRVRAATARVSPALRTVRQHPSATATIDFLPELRPAWWVARGWLLVVGFWLIGANAWGRYVLPEILGSTLLGVAAGIACAAASVHIARHRPDWRLRHVVDALAVVAAVAFLVRGDDLEPAGADVVEFSFPGDGAEVRHPDGSPITNIYAYDTAGEPLDDVRLFDQDGRPIEVPDSDDWYAGPQRRDEVFGAGGLPLWNVYPIDRFAFEWDPATGTEASRPVPDPLLVVPPLPSPAPAADEGAGPGASSSTTSTTPGTATSSTTSAIDSGATGSASTLPAGEPAPGS